MAVSILETCVYPRHLARELTILPLRHLMMYVYIFKNESILLSYQPAMLELNFLYDCNPYGDIISAMDKDYKHYTTHVTI